MPLLVTDHSRVAYNLDPLLEHSILTAPLRSPRLHPGISPTDIVRQYRKLDDQVVTRLNRAQAQLRDEARAGKGSSPEGMCAKMWSEMMGE